MSDTLRAIAVNAEFRICDPYSMLDAFMAAGDPPPLLKRMAAAAAPAVGCTLKA